MSLKAAFQKQLRGEEVSGNMLKKGEESGGEVELTSKSGDSAVENSSSGALPSLATFDAPPPQTSFGTSSGGSFGYNFSNGASRSSGPPPVECYDGTPGFYSTVTTHGVIAPDCYSRTGVVNASSYSFASNGVQAFRGRGSGGSRRGAEQSFRAMTQLPATPECDDRPEKPMSVEELALLNKFLHKKVEMMQEAKVHISEMQRDPTSPLFSAAASFRDLRLKPELIQALEVMGFESPSKIQESALPLLLMEPPTNVIAQAQSGTGKTAAFLLTMLSRVVVENEWPQCICLAPTYELAKQIGEVLLKMAKFMPSVHVHYAVRGVKPPAAFAMKEQFIIGTPGKLVDYVTKYRCFDPAKIICMALDEADVMISQQGHLDLSHRIYSAIEKSNPAVQSLLFSATYNPQVYAFAQTLIKKAMSIILRKEEQALPNIKQYLVECSNRDAKYQAVCDLYGGLCIASSVIFTYTKASAQWLCERMVEKGYEVVVLHGDLTVEQRAHAIEQFKEGKYRVLITTNVCARGIDVCHVSIVINYDPPFHYERPDEPDYETYIHRIGRTGRFGKGGIAINFVDSQKALDLYKKLESHFGKPILKLEPSDMEQLEAIEND